MTSSPVEEGIDMADRARLSLVKDQKDSSAAPMIDALCEIEEAVLGRAVHDMDGWIRSLPTASEFRWSFLRARRTLEDERDALRSAARTVGRR